MLLHRNKLYSIILVSCTAGYVWLWFDMYGRLSLHSDVVRACLIKRLTGLPCPSCGSTRSVEAILDGKYIEAMLINPIGYVLVSIMLAAPLWILFDLLTKRQTLFDFYGRRERCFKKSAVVVVFTLLIILNWIWNIDKAL